MKRSSIKIFIFLNILFILFNQSNVWAQQYDEQTFVNHIANRLFDNVASLNEEKLFLHVDKSVALPGDTLWFRAFLASALTNQLVDYSRYIYVELADRTDSVHFREKIARSGEDSLFVGYFIIPETLSQGEYFLRSYTYWMQNVPVDYYDVKRIRVINPFDHRVKIDFSVERRRDGKSVVVSFKNTNDILYENVEFLYRVPGEMPNGQFVNANTGYSGKCRIVLNDTASDCILIKSPIGAKLDFERLIKLNDVPRDFHISFLPEGGDLVMGGVQRIGVKCIGRNGLGVAVSGSVYGKDGVLVATFETNKLGVGSFEFYVEDEVYTSVVESSEAYIKRFDLPMPRENASDVLRLDANEGYVRVELLGASGDDRFLLIHSRGITLGVYDINEIGGTSMDFSGAPEGIIHFLVIDDNCRVYSERLWYNRKYNRPRLILEEPYQRSSEREDELVTLYLEGNGIDELEGDFSVSVVNNSYAMTDGYDAGLDAYMLLTSELSGYVECPGYYFEADDYEHTKALDDLMLTQGWRRFDVEKMLLLSEPVKPDYYMERGQFLSGRVEDMWGRKSANSEIYLYGSNGVESYATTDENGEFLVEDIYFHEGTHFTATATNSKGRSNVVISLDNQLFKPLKNIIPESVFERSNDFEFYEKYGRDYIYSDEGVRLSALGEVSVLKGYKQRTYEVLRDSLEKRSTNLFMLGITDVKDFGGYGTFKNSWGDLIESPAKKIPHKYDNGNTVYQPGSPMDNISYYERIYNKYSPEAYRSSNMRSTGAHYRFVAKDMERPQLLGVVLDSDHFWGGGGGAYGGFGAANPMELGTIGVYATQVPHFELSFNIQTIVPLAPQLSEFVEFYQPEYEAVPEERRILVDEMATRYWNPRVRFGEDEIFNVVFPRAAGGDSYTIVVEGYTSDGTPIHFSKIIR